MLRGYKKAFKGFLLRWYHSEVEWLEQTCPSVHTLSEWVVFCCAIIPRGQQEFLCCSMVENVIPQRWIVNIVFISLEHELQLEHVAQRWALPCLSSKQITRLPRVYTAFCLSFWLARAHESAQTDMSIKHSDTRNNNGRLTPAMGIILTV